MPRIAFFAGSFDPVTLGHVDLIARGLKLFDKLVVGIGVHHGKTPMFSAEERIAMLRTEIGAMGASPDAFDVVTFDNLVVDAALSHGAAAILRGVRDGTDFDYEMQMAGMNGTLAPDLDTVFLPASPGHRHIAATFVRQIAQMGGDVAAFVTPSVAQKLKQKLDSPAQ